MNQSGLFLLELHGKFFNQCNNLSKRPSRTNVQFADVASKQRSKVLHESSLFNAVDGASEV